VATNQPINIPPGTFTSTLAGLFQKGIRYSTVIDAGCADGHFYVFHHRLGLFPGSTVVNIDPNLIYEDSLKQIKDVMGGHYVIAAASDGEGELEMTTAAHPYWNSLRPADDSYWEKNNRMNTGTVKVPAITLDGLAAKLDLSGPYLLKLDVQGAETKVLHGARQVLARTHVVICECDMDDFQAVNEALVEAGFGLYDVTQLNWVGDRSLAWFYPVYLHHSLDHVRPRALWDKAQNQQIVQVQRDRRQLILKQLAEMLAEQKAARTKG
jgi:FkbM family methyltransferase